MPKCTRIEPAVVDESEFWASCVTPPPANTQEETSACAGRAQASTSGQAKLASRRAKRRAWGRRGGRGCRTKAKELNMSWSGPSIGR